MPVRDKPLAYIDTETTSLDCEVAQVLEVCVVIPAKNIRFSSKVAPEDISKADPSSLRINGYTDEAWVGAPPAAEVLALLPDMLEGCVIVGKNPGFDLSVIGCQMRRLGLGQAFRRIPYHKLDVTTLAWLALGDKLESLSLNSVCKELGLTNEGEHRAEADVDRTIAAFGTLESMLLG